MTIVAIVLIGWPAMVGSLCTAPFVGLVGTVGWFVARG
jgi:hypothetical protein